MEHLYYNIFGNETDAFLGTIRVEVERDPPMTDKERRMAIIRGPLTWKEPPATRARKIAVEILSPALFERDPTGNCVGGAPGGIRAVMSSEEMFNQYGLNREGGLDSRF